MTTKPILRVGKIHASGRSTPSSVGGHLARSVPTPNADPARLKLNQWLVGEPNPDLSAAITGVMKKAGIDPTKLRKDAVLANDILLTVSPEWFRPDDPSAHGTWTDDRLQIFIAESKKLLTKTFGQRIVSAVLHLDEATPHVQAIVVPIVGKKGEFRLSAKEAFTPARLTQLQQDWEDQMRPHGVGPRTKGSRATHTTLKDFYGTVDAFQDEDVRIDVQITEPPLRAFLETPAAHRQRTDEWRKTEAKRLRDELRPLTIEASRGRLYDAERRRSIELRGDLAASAQNLGSTRSAMVKAQDALAMAKNEITRLRSIPINSVAAALGFHDEIKPKENAIDLVKRAGGLDYNSAVNWLAQNFSVDTAATAIREHALPGVQEAAKASLVSTKAEKVKSRLISQQLDALAAPGYRITVMTSLDGKRIGRNLGKRKDGSEQLFGKADILEIIPRLTSENSRGGNIFITPIDPAVHHVLADDLTAAGLEDLTKRGYAPAVVLETSPNSHQAILKVPVSAAPKAAINAWFKDLNRDIGDTKITGLIHPFRLAGFENRKEKHLAPDGRFPFVHLVEAVNRLCGRATGIVRAYASKQLLLEVATATKSPLINNSPTAYKRR